MGSLHKLLPNTKSVCFVAVCCISPTAKPKSECNKTPEEYSHRSKSKHRFRANDRANIPIPFPTLSQYILYINIKQTPFWGCGYIHSFPIHLLYIYSFALYPNPVSRDMFVVSSGWSTVSERCLFNAYTTLPEIFSNSKPNLPLFLFCILLGQFSSNLQGRIPFVGGVFHFENHQPSFYFWGCGIWNTLSKSWLGTFDPRKGIRKSQPKCLCFEAEFILHFNLVSAVSSIDKISQMPKTSLLTTCIPLPVPHYAKFLGYFHTDRAGPDRADMCRKICEYSNLPEPCPSIPHLPTVRLCVCQGGSRWYGGLRVFFILPIVECGFHKCPV